MKMYVLKDKNNVMFPSSFMSLDDAEQYKKAFAVGDWELFETQHFTFINAQNYIIWSDLPKHLSFIYRDHEGVWASQYKPISKWYTKDNNQIFRMYGGERLKLDYRNYHELINLGDVFENRNNNKHFLNWKKVKGAHFVKYIDNDNQSIDVFSKDGELIFSGSNDDLNIIHKKGSFQFEKFPWQTYTFVKT